MPVEDGVWLDTALRLSLALALEIKNSEPIFMKMHVLTEVKELWFLTLG